MPQKKTKIQKKETRKTERSPKPKKVVEKPEKVKTPQKREEGERFIGAIGRRKTAVARIRLFTKGDKEILINEKSLKAYFPTADLQQIVVSPLEKADALSGYRVVARVRGGGVHAQAEAVRHGIARALVLFDSELRSRMKKAGFLTRDARMRERKKFGLKRARRAPQWRKR